MNIVKETEYEITMPKQHLRWLLDYALKGHYTVLDQAHEHNWPHEWDAEHKEMQVLHDRLLKEESSTMKHKKPLLRSYPVTDHTRMLLIEDHSLINANRLLRLDKAAHRFRLRFQRWFYKKRTRRILFRIKYYLYV